MSKNYNDNDNYNYGNGNPYSDYGEEPFENNEIYDDEPEEEYLEPIDFDTDDDEEEDFNNDNFQYEENYDYDDEDDVVVRNYKKNLRINGLSPRYIDAYSTRDMNMDYIPKMNISDFEIKNREIENINVEYLTLSKAKFENVTFFNTFVKGVFFQCEFINCKFLNAFEDGVQRYDCLYVNCTFINCGKPEPYEFYNCKIINENRIEIEI